MQVSNMNYAKFINYIATQELLPNVQTMANRLNLSSRKIYYLLQAANSDLRSSNQPFLVTSTKILDSQISVLKKSYHTRHPMNTLLRMNGSRSWIFVLPSP